LFSLIFFFFQAEDGIRDRNVTGVQTCALPIYPLKTRRSALVREDRSLSENSSRPRLMARSIRSFRPLGGHSNSSNIASLRYTIRSEERRVGKEGRYRRSRYMCREVWYVLRWSV